MDLIYTVNASDMPEDVLDYCLDTDISTHCQNDIVYIEDDNNPFANWLRSVGYVFVNRGGWIGIFAT